MNCCLAKRTKGTMGFAQVIIGRGPQIYRISEQSHSFSFSFYPYQAFADLCPEPCQHPCCSSSRPLLLNRLRSLRTCCPPHR